MPLAHAFVRSHPETFAFTAATGGAFIVSCDPSALRLWRPPRRRASEN